MKRIKICFATREYEHPNMGKFGGIGVFVKQYARQLQHYNFDITIFSFGTHPERFNDERITVIKIKDLSSFNEWIKAPLRRHKVLGYITIKKLLEFFNRVYVSFYISLYAFWHKFDLIEFHDYGGDFTYFFGKLPKVVRCHGTALTLHQFMGYVNRVSDSIFEKQFFKRFNKHVVAVSKISAEMTQKAFQLKVFPKVIYNGVIVPELELPESYLNTPTEEYSIFYFGSIRERKGIDIACKVFNAIIENFPKATFHVLGNNNNDYWNTHAKHILTEMAIKQTTYYGAIQNNKVNDYLKRAHVVLFPSYGENFSIALLEVMALGKIVITSSIPAFQEIIIPNKNGFIAKDELEYIKYLDNIFKNNIPIEEISKHAFLTIKNKFEITDIMQQNIAYYKSLL